MAASSNTSSPRKTIPLLDLKGDYAALRGKLNAAALRVLASCSYVLGEENKRFEEEVARYCGVRRGIALNSGTDAIWLALRALNVGRGDEVILPATTFIATAEPVIHLGARPVFVDVDPRTFNIDPRQVETQITSRTKAIIAVHLYGQPADLDALGDIADARRLPLIEDMAQSIGAAFQGKKVGGFGRAACLSFYPTKNLGGCGDGGMVLTSDEELAFRLQRLRNHGARVKYDHEEVGYNSRLDELQAALLRVKLGMLDRWNKKRAELASVYTRELARTPLQLPFVAPGRTHVYHLYTVCTPQRDALKDALAEQGIQTGIHYPKPLHLQTAFKFLEGKAGDFPHSERLSREVLCLPMHPHLSKTDQQRVIKTIQTFFKTHGG
jgi:dTDP-4-amino-4,6-dideoxygalactose transaminase